MVIVRSLAHIGQILDLLDRHACGAELQREAKHPIEVPLLF
jgi:hypothetical protein